MATRAILFYEKADGRTSVIYTHFDGYPSHHLPILNEHYATEDAVQALFALGDLEVLAESPECPPGHTFTHPIKGYCVAYGRDRGEPNTKAQNCYCLDIAILNSKCGENYRYFFRANTQKWTYQDLRRV